MPEEASSPVRGPDTRHADPAPPDDERWAGIPPPPDEPDLVALRELVLRHEIALLERLRQRLDDPLLHARDVSNVVAEALLLRAGRDDKLTRSLEPVVEDIFKTALRKSPAEFATALFPLMGPAIRRSIVETFHGMLQSFNKSLEMSFSWQGLRWRLEAMRTGKPFSEIVLLRTLIYRVEQIFLIHSNTGLVLAHEVNEGVESQDADMVSAMLTAIQDFVQDCFAGGRQGELESLQLGEFTILVEKGPYAYIACVVRGTPPVGFRDTLRTSLELILVECADALRRFTGDTSPFVLARRRLRDCMVSRFQERGEKLPLWIKILPVLVLLGLAGAFGLWRYQLNLEQREVERLAAEELGRQTRFQQHMTECIDALRREPGLLVLYFQPCDDSPWNLTCLRDPMARDPHEVLREAGAAKDSFVLDVVPFISLESAMIARRAAAAIHPPKGASMRLDDDGVLHLSGTADTGWILRARQQALALPGVTGVDIGGISDPRMDRLKTLMDEVEATAIHFPPGKDTPTPEDAPKLEQVITTLVRIEQLAGEMGFEAELTVYGHADAQGSEKRNYELSLARTRTLAAMLYFRGSSLQVSMYGLGAAQALDDAKSLADPGSRRVELRVRLTRAGSAPYAPDSR